MLLKQWLCKCDEDSGITMWQVAIIYLAIVVFITGGYWVTEKDWQRLNQQNAASRSATPEKLDALSARVRALENHVYYDSGD